MDVRRIDDVDSLKSAAALSDSPVVDAEGFLADPATIAVAAELESQLIGWAWGHKLRRPDGRWMLLLYEIDVTSEHRRRGVGTALVEAMKTIAVAEGCEEMWLATEAGNEEALGLYRATGGQWTSGGDVVVAWDLASK